MQVFNALGQPIATLMQNEPHAKGSYRTTLDASMFPSGLYTVYVSTPGFGISKQIVVTKQANRLAIAERAQPSMRPYFLGNR